MDCCLHMDGHHQSSCSPLAATRRMPPVRVVLLQGGPPWGFRIGSDPERRPVIGKIAAGGRAYSAGMSVGDAIEAINGRSVVSAVEANSVVQTVNGGCLEMVMRRPSSAVVISSVLDSPVPIKKEFGPGPRFQPAHPRHDPHYSPNLPRSLRLDPAERGLRTQDKRRFFESLNVNSPRLGRDPYLARKVQQMGLIDANMAPPSENGTVSGYDSVFGDICGDICSASRLSSQASVRSDIPSSVNSVNGDDDACDQTLALDVENTAPTAEQTSPLPQYTPLSFSSIMEPASGSAGPQLPPSPAQEQQWQMRAEVHNAEPARSEIEVPGRRSVAALREHIADKLDIRGPETPGKQRPKTPIKSWIRVHEAGSFDESLPSASSNDFPANGFGRVIDGPPPPNANYFQGVPPPSYNFVPHKHNPNDKPRPAPETNGNVKQQFDTTAYSKRTEPVENKENGYGHLDLNLGGGSALESQPHSPVVASSESRARSCVTPARTERPSIERVSVERATLQSSSDLESAELSRRQSNSYSSLSSDHLGTIRRRPNEGQPEAMRTDDHESPSDSGYDASPDSRKDSMLTVRSSPPPPFSSAPPPLSGSSDAFSTLPPSILSKEPLPRLEPLPQLPPLVPKEQAKDPKDYLKESYREQRQTEREEGRRPDVAVSPNYRKDGSEMGNWYRNMYKQLHKIEGDGSILKYYLNDASPVPSSRPHTPSSRRASPPLVRQSPAVDVDNTRRSASVGRDILPSSASSSAGPRPAYERLSEAVDPVRAVTPVGRPSQSSAQKTVHFHLPSYRFVDEDSRGLVTPCGRSCLRCGLPRKDDGLERIYAVVNREAKERAKRERAEREEQQSIAASRIADRLESTAAELEEFLASLDRQWPPRSVSSPAIHPSTSKEDRGRMAREAARRAVDQRKKAAKRLDLAQEIEQLKRVTNEEMATSVRAEKLGVELDQARRHGYIPNSVPPLHSNMDRFNGLLNAYGGDERGASPARSVSSASGVRMAIALYRFVPQTDRELALNKGDIVRLRREIDGNWLEGERNGRVGIFPASYVDIEECTESRPRLRAVYPFTGRNSNEMSLKLGDVVTFRRAIDDNWTEGINHIGEIGIFPSCYVRPIDEITPDLPSLVPDRPKTPKLPGVSFAAPVLHAPTVDGPFPSYDRPQERVDRRAAPSLPLPQPSFATSTTPRDQSVSITLPYPVPDSVPSQPVREERARTDPAKLDRTLDELLSSLPTSLPRMNGHHHQASDKQPTQPSAGPAVPTSNNDKNTRVRDVSKSSSIGRDASDLSDKPLTDKVAAWQQRHSANGFTGAARIIPKGAQTFRAVFPYSPQNDDELELQMDDIVFVVEKCDDGWFIGTLLRTGQFGTFPGNFVEPH